MVKLDNDFDDAFHNGSDFKSIPTLFVRFFGLIDGTGANWVGGRRGIETRIPGLCLRTHISRNCLLVVGRRLRVYGCRAYP